MKYPILLAASFTGLQFHAMAEVVPKTNYSQPIDPALVTAAPYRQTGLVTTSAGRASGFVASDRKLFFTAAHAVRGDAAWGASPAWYAEVNDEVAPPLEDAVLSRGYFRWEKYATDRTTYGQDSKQAFGHDVILAWGNEDFIAGTPAAIDYGALKRLTHGQPCMITGYPSTVDFTGESGGYFQHATTYQAEDFNDVNYHYLYAGLLSTGPANSGGPVWTQDPTGNWLVSGALVSGKPAEAGVYAMTNDIKSMLKAAAPAIQDPRKTSVFINGVRASACFWPMKHAKNIPDGVMKFTVIPLTLKNYPKASKVTSLVLNLDVTTTNAGDLLVVLQSPDGVSTTVFDDQSSTEENLVLTDMDLDLPFANALANGKWQLKVQDRLKGDLATVTRFSLEVGAEAITTAPATSATP